MDRMKFETADGALRNMEKIAGLFPQAVTEVRGEDGAVKRAVKWDVLRELLSGEFVEGGERYEFTWPGKREAIAEAAKPIRKTLRPCKDESKAWDSTENLYIEGDNLEVLKLLQESYLGKVKMIYIDPPYNTGKDFVYRDNFHQSKAEYEDELDLTDEDENRLFQNTESNGRFHSDWCSMIYPRLVLANNLLREDGIILVSIDDNEVENLRGICNEIFGEANFIDCIIWKKRYGGGPKERYLVTVHEYVLVYAKKLSSIEQIVVPLTDEAIKRYYTQKDSNFNKFGPYRTHPLEATKSMETRPNLVFPIPTPDGGTVMPERQWLWGRDRVNNALKNGEIEFIKNNTNGWSVHSKQYLKDESGNIRPAKAQSIIDNVFTQHGTNEIIDIFGNARIFSFPKPIGFIKQLLNIGFNASSDGIILDFFSGSATTAHAVMQLNAEDGGKRKFIMVQLPEPCQEDSETSQAGFTSICEIGKERIRRAGEKIAAEWAAKRKTEEDETPLLADSGETATGSLDTGFRVFKLDDTNMKDVYYSADEYSQDMLDTLVSNIKEDRSDLDLLYGCLLDWGVELSQPHTSEQLDGVTVHTVNDGDLIACFDANVPEPVIREIAKRKPLRAVFRDASFSSTPEKINVEEIFKLLSPTTTVKVI